MQILAFDLAYKKPTTGYDPGRNKNFEVGVGEKVFEKYLDTLKEPHILLFEPGMTIYMLLSFHRGHMPMYAATSTTCEFRRNLGREKTDELDPETIYLCYNAGEKFYEFSPLDEKRAILRLLSRQQEEAKKEKVRRMNRRYAAEHNFKVSNLSGDWVKGVFEGLEATIEGETKTKIAYEQLMAKVLKEFALPEWVGFLEPIKGVGSVIGAAFIGFLANADLRFDRAGLRHYCRVVPDKYQGSPGKNRKMVDRNGRRDLACILHLFVEGVMKAKDPVYYWRYLDKKGYLQKKNPTWKPFEIDRGARLYVKQRFLTDYRNFLINVRNGNS